ncbi:MAG: OBAP family protein [Pseudomonadota bacterium]
MLTLSALVVACGDNNSPSNFIAPGDETRLKTRVLETGTSLLQGKEPLEAMNVYMDGFHFYNGDMQARMEAHHFCSVVNEEINQCVIFNGNGTDAKLMGVETIISKKLFDALLPEEKKLWHSHVHEVKRGQPVAPGIPQKAGYEFIEKLISTYGKTWHTWHADQELTRPLGHPVLLMGFTADGQVDEAMVAQRDNRMRISSAEKRQHRQGMPATANSPGAGSWQQGEVMQRLLRPLASGAAVPHSQAHRHVQLPAGSGD